MPMVAAAVAVASPPTPAPTEVAMVPTTGSTIAGIMAYPGTTNNAGIVVALFSGSNVLKQVTTDATGAYQLTAVPVGTYTLAWGAPQAIPTQHNVVIQTDGQIIDMGTNLVLMGDTDDNGTIDLQDATLVAINFGNPADAVPNADLNHDGKIERMEKVLTESAWQT